MSVSCHNAVPALIVLLVAVPIYVLRLDHVVGMVVDDAWYVMLAKGLAEGRGYQLINAPIDGILPGYPPGFPALLSLVFHLSPDFPGNVWLLKSVSMAAMFGVATLSYWYLHQLRRLPRHLAALAAIGIATTPVVCVSGDVDGDVRVCLHAWRNLESWLLRTARSRASAGTRLAARRDRRPAWCGDGPDSLGRCGVVVAVFLCFVKERQWKRCLHLRSSWRSVSDHG